MNHVFLITLGLAVFIASTLAAPVISDAQTVQKTEDKDGIRIRTIIYVPGGVQQAPQNVVKEIYNVQQTIPGAPRVETVKIVRNYSETVSQGAPVVQTYASPASQNAQNVQTYAVPAPKDAQDVQTYASPASQNAQNVQTYASPAPKDVQHVQSPSYATPAPKDAQTYATPAPKDVQTYATPEPKDAQTYFVPSSAQQNVQTYVVPSSAQQSPTAQSSSQSTYSIQLSSELKEALKDDPEVLKLIQDQLNRGQQSQDGTETNVHLKRHYSSTKTVYVPVTIRREYQPSQ